ncbi:MAG TPA: hypothetical protein VKB52_03885 [Rhodanobacteraceae bacterium]|nr:hypothetical protein [Rhodanobacteraceae bacterium]
MHVEAATRAADALADRLGLAGAPLAAGGTPLRTLLQRIKAATLSDRIDEARRLVESATPEQRADPELRFRAAKVDAQAGRSADAESALRALLDDVGAERDPVLRARVFDALGVIALQRGDAVAAEKNHDEAISLLAAGRDAVQLGKAYGNRAAARLAQHEDEAALRDFARARAALADAGDALSLAFLDANLAAMDMLRDRYRDAWPIFERAALKLEALRIDYAALNDWDAAAQSHLLLLEPAAASRIEPRLRALAGRVADPALRIGAGLTRVEILAANGASAMARTLLSDLRNELARGDLPPALVARAQAIEARLLLADGDATGAMQAARNAFAMLTDTDDARVRERNWLTLVRAEIAGGGNAAKSVQLIGKLRDAAPAPAARIYAALAAAELDRSRGDDDAARAAFAAALADADANGRVPIDMLAAVDGFLRWLIRTGDLATASGVAERVMSWTGQSYEASLVPLRLYHAAGLASAWSAALANAQALAGERRVPAALAAPPR